MCSGPILSKMLLFALPLMLTNLLQMLIFIRHGISGILGEGTVHNNLLLGEINLQSVLHNSNLPFIF